MCYYPDNEYDDAIDRAMCERKREIEDRAIEETLKRSPHGEPQDSHRTF